MPATTLAATSTATTASIPSTTSQPTRHGAVFFISLAPDILAPLACYDADAKKVLTEDDCLALLPLGGSIRDSGDKVLALARARVENHDCYTGSTFAAPGAEFAIWPQDAALQMQRVAANDKPNAAESKLLDKAVKAKTKVAYQVTRVASLDLDGDQKPERFFSVVAKQEKKDQEATGDPFAFSGLFLLEGKKPNGLVLLVSSKRETFTVLGGLDVEGDGQVELWIEKLLFEEEVEVGREQSLQRLIKGALESFAARNGC